MDRNPGRIIKEFRICLPANRTMEVKRSSEYIKYVNEIEDEIFKLG
jgi:hypothetical protein